MVGHDIAVPPGTEQVLQGYAHSCEFDGPVVLEPTLNIPGLEATRALTQVESGKIPCMVRNITTECITIPRHTSIGDLQIDYIGCG